MLSKIWFINRFYVKGCKNNKTTDIILVIPELFLFNRGKIVNYTDAMELTKYLKNETRYVPWSAGRWGLGGLISILPKSRPAYKYMQVCWSPFTVLWQVCWSIYSASQPYRRFQFQWSRMKQREETVNFFPSFCLVTAKKSLRHLLNSSFSISCIRICLALKTFDKQTFKSSL